MSTLEQFRTHVNEQYQTALGLNLTTDSSSTTNQPIWIPDSDKAWILDAEIGLALRVVPYTNADDDLTASIQEAVRTATQLQPHYGITDAAADNFGIWQVSICWLVKSQLCEDWRKRDRKSTRLNSSHQ